MKASIHEFVHACVVYQQSKPDRAMSPGFLQPLPMPSVAWQVVSLDFIEGLPLYALYNCILDLLTKYAHFIPLRHPFTTATVAQSFLDQVYRLHGLPNSIVSDCDCIFTSKF